MDTSTESTDTTNNADFAAVSSLHPTSNDNVSGFNYVSLPRVDLQQPLGEEWRTSNRLVKNGVLATASTKYHECSIRQKTDVVQSLVKKRLYFSLHAALRSKKFETVKDPQQGMTLAAALDTTLPSKRAGIASVHRRPKPAITINTGMVSVGAKRPQPTPVFPPTFSWNDILCVQHLIERCLRQYLSKNDILIILKEQANVDPAFADVVWQKLEEQNTRFFSRVQFATLA